MKRISCLLLALCFIAVTVNAQDEEEAPSKGFKKENLFTGGSITLSFFNGQTVLGANPVFGYKLADWVDAGIAFNFLYNGARDYLQFNDKIRQTVLGPGVFTRLYPVRFLFVQGQLEENFSTLKYKPVANGSYAAYTDKQNATSLLLGGGFAQGREPGSTTFFYISLLFDVLKNENSPYVNVNVDENTGNRRITMAPIIRAGVNIGLFQGRYR